MFTRILRLVLIALAAFLAITAFAGGIGLLANLNAPPVEMLAGSPFRDYTVPGVALFVIVGGSALAAAYWLAARRPHATALCLWSGLAIIGFEVIEILVIGYEPGISGTLQVFYLSLGALISLLSAALWRTQAAPTRRTEAASP